MDKLTLTIPVKTVSEGNLRQHWATVSNRKKKQRQLVRLWLNTVGVNFDINGVFSLKVTRIAPRRLDSHDNLGSSLKTVIDAVCEWLAPGLATGRADSSEIVKEILTAQEKGAKRTYEVKVEITRVGAFKDATIEKECGGNGMGSRADRKALKTPLIESRIKYDQAT